MFKKNIIFISAFVMILGFANSIFAARGAAEVTITPAKDAFASDDSVLVNVAITNPNRNTIRILRWYTPFDGVKEDLFAVTVNGKAVEYTGADYKRPEPTEKDYIMLKSGETLETTIDLAGFYDFSESGYYEISYNVEGLQIFSREVNLLAGSDALSSKGVQFWVSGRDSKAPAQPPVDSVAGSTGFSGCTSTRQTQLVTARDNAYTYSLNALNYLNTGTVGPRYTTWFGKYTSSNYSTVRNNFSAIQSAMNSAAVTFNCSCTDSAYAYVYSNQPYTIYLCNAFWSAPATGTDSKAGTLVHEMSHFSVVAGTGDYAYGQTAAKRLAQTNPKRAIKNADSHEYFAENTPAQQ
ncbi:MAG TPA: M35 family metallo-endopeptidase [Pyrinomonadaceae bacterium]